MAYLFVNLDHALVLNVTGHHFSFPFGNLVVQNGILGQDPSCSGRGSCGIGGSGA